MAKLVDQDAEGRVSTIAYVQAPGDESDFDREAARQTAPSFGSAVNAETGDGMTDHVAKPQMTAEQIREQRRALCCSILTLLMSIPAMIGA